MDATEIVIASIGLMFVMTMIWTQQHRSTIRWEYVQLIGKVLKGDWSGPVIGPTGEQVEMFEQLAVHITMRDDGMYIVSVDGPYEINYTVSVCQTIDLAHQCEDQTLGRMRHWLTLSQPLPAGRIKSTKLGER